MTKALNLSFKWVDGMSMRQNVTWNAWDFSFKKRKINWNLQSYNGASELIRTVWLSIHQLHFNSWYFLVQVLSCLVTSFIMLTMYYRLCTTQVSKSHEIIIWLFFFFFFCSSVHCLILNHFSLLYFGNATDGRPMNEMAVCCRYQMFRRKNWKWNENRN